VTSIGNKVDSTFLTEANTGNRYRVKMQQELLTMDKERELAPLNPRCVVCGSSNPKGLRVSFQQNANGICADWIPTSEWEGFQGTIHGGIIATILDEAMSKAIIARNWEALTVDLRVRFRGRVSPGQVLHVRGWVVEKQRRKILTEAALTSDTGEERAHAWATFLVPPRGLSGRTRDAAGVEPRD